MARPPHRRVGNLMRITLVLAAAFLITVLGANEVRADPPSHPFHASCTATPTSAGVYGSCTVGDEGTIPIQAGCDTCAPLIVGPTCTVSFNWVNSAAGCR